jgi:hypothetical protein
MRKIVIINLFMSLFLMSNENNKLDWPLACTVLETSNYLYSDRYISIDSFILFDTKTIKIDRKNKQIEVSVINLLTNESKEYLIQELEQYGDVTNIGYFTTRYIIDYANMKSKAITIGLNNCNGHTITKTNIQKRFSYMSSNSIENNLLETIIKKYKLNSDDYSFMGVVNGLDPKGDGFLSIRDKLPKNGNSHEIGRLYNGDKVKIIGKEGTWYKIQLKNTNGYGWSHANWIN